MKRYLIYGLSGSGKSSVGNELAIRGYRVIEADFDYGISSWINKDTGEKVEHKPPFTQKWLVQHAWRWDAEKINKVLQDEKYPVIFLVGGADNMEDFIDMFDKKFALFVDDATMIERLKSREPERWIDESPEMIRVKNWNKGFLTNHKSSDTVLIDGTQPVEHIADRILSEINDD